MTSLGSGRGALVGVPLGVAAGAIAAEFYYDDDQELVAEHATQMQAVTEQLRGSETRIAELDRALEEEKARAEALLEAHENLRRNSAARDPVLQALAGPAEGASPDFGPDVQVSTVDSGGIKLTLLSEVLFGSGKAGLTAEGKKVLSQAALSIRKHYPSGVIEVHGHTDNVPIRYSKFQSNWELSCARALSVVHHLIEREGFDAASMMAAGLADTRPVAGNDSAQGRRKNRRAEIIIRPNETEMAAWAPQAPL
jgi:chemotaxis protein MotB